jgi:glycosyltransferase involved in cell wall biosynthesis
VISSAYGFPVFELAYRISRKFKIPLAIHAVDPLPSTAGWGENQHLRKSIVSIIKPYYKHAIIVSSTNEAMLNYQKNMIGEKFIQNSFVLPNPYSPLKNKLAAPLEQKSFVYLGSIYGKRNIQHLIGAFTIFCDTHQDAKLYFVGPIYAGKATISEHVADKIVLINWTDEPEIFISKCAILVDIDADIQNDVFISSKLTNYLVADRVILSISPPDSPARKLMQYLHNTVVVTADSKAEILNALEEALNKSQNLIDFGERNEIRNYLSPRTVAKKLLDNLKSVLTKGNSF